MNPIRFLKGSYTEFKKVEWPSRKQTLLLTAYVIGVSLVVAFFVASADLVFKEFIKVLL
ncbi:preprotein translocase subunit SecE [Candidatus Nomurabacteria bacterium]|uniref:Protein translocase subunit SecE n=1 Tax=candidate division WWE3 bacterium TaxID=2053526 RepID=A0A955IVZ7_UNCKA|nr:preprotein translocase subunit SecE [candidate division WWE3 bacterium]MCB9823637.1 preprotein translocase subunit SecE [Candidatus Nomurabacteria bacterium]MCB9827285.1 preprotein translocase subunit SecE [Candidatus Nomurabacteria bacterium]MCB9827432.1 preprotein translocase subunit SecE [Candidatus Nomurabacteria bacterium]